MKLWMKQRLTIRLGLTLLVLLLASGCQPGPEPGRVEIRVRDHREAIADFKELWLTFSLAGIHPAHQPRTEGWLELKPVLRELNLTEYVDGREAVIVQAMVEATSYNAVRLVIERASGTLTTGQSVAVVVGFETVAVNFPVQSGRTTVLDLDLMVLDLSDHSEQGYELQLRTAAVARIE
jgi:hypothetical protein